MFPDRGVERHSRSEQHRADPEPVRSGTNPVICRDQPSRKSSDSELRDMSVASLRWERRSLCRALSMHQLGSF
mgnify:CR=1 FL=1